MLVLVVSYSSFTGWWILITYSIALSQCWSNRLLSLLETRKRKPFSCCALIIIWIPQVLFYFCHQIRWCTRHEKKTHEKSRDFNLKLRHRWMTNKELLLVANYGTIIRLHTVRLEWDLLLLQKQARRTVPLEAKENKLISFPFPTATNKARMLMMISVVIWVSSSPELCPERS